MEQGFVPHPCGGVRLGRAADAWVWKVGSGLEFISQHHYLEILWSLRNPDGYLFLSVDSCSKMSWTRSQ